MTPSDLATLVQQIGPLLAAWGETQNLTRELTPVLVSADGTTLLDQAVHTSWATVRDTLKTHQICTIVLPTDHCACLRIRKAATPDPEVRQLYQLLHIAPDIIKPQRTWTPHGSD